MHVYCIHCEEHSERKAATAAHLREWGIEVTWWRGINGRRWGLDTTLYHAPGEKVAPGIIGCLLSHYTLWQHLLYAGIPEALIVEDDVFLADDFPERFRQQYERLPSDWQFCYVGYLPRPEAIIPFGTFCYLLRLSAIPFLLQRLGQADSPLDCQLIRELPALRTVIFDPSLAVDRSFMRKEWPNCY